MELVKQLNAYGASPATQKDNHQGTKAQRNIEKAVFPSILIRKKNA
jgi:hypothetical protein